jgi:hypothetical protein
LAGASEQSQEFQRFTPTDSHFRLQIDTSFGTQSVEAIAACSAGRIIPPALFFWHIYAVRAIIFTQSAYVVLQFTQSAYITLSIDAAPLPSMKRNAGRSPNGKMETTMNTERILKLADVIEAQPHTDIEAESGFTMLSYSHVCGTPACIAGWAYWLETGKAIRVEQDVSVEAGALLDLGPSKQNQLFMPDFSWSGITPPHAAAVLRNLAATGEVDWSVGAPSDSAEA